MNHLRRHSTPVLLVLSMLASGGRLHANMADPLQLGSALGEPRAALAGLVIEREVLRIDLRPLALEPGDDEASEGFGRALVSATYIVRNDSVGRPITLEFVAQAIDTAQWTVSIDGRPITAFYRAGDRSRDHTIDGARGWTVPAWTPGIGSAPLRYDATAAGLLRFDTHIAPGRHTIRVEYVAEATRQVVDHPLVHWQLGYILEPARRWPSFGTLELSVLLPPDWSAATEPRLERSGDVLRGTFEEIPADALTITARAVHEPWYPLVGWIPAVIAAILGFIGAYRLGRGIGRRLARNGRRAAWALPAAVGVGLVLAVAVPTAGLAGAAIEESLIGAGQGAWGRYTFLFVEGLLAVVAFITGTALVQVAAARTVRRARRRYDARWIESWPAEQASDSTPHANGSIRQEQE